MTTIYQTRPCHCCGAQPLVTFVWNQAKGNVTVAVSCPGDGPCVVATSEAVAYAQWNALNLPDE